MVVLTYVTPDVDWWTTITTIPNDGKDHEIVFMGGVYDTPTSLLVGNIDILHTNGGSITLRAQIPGNVIINVKESGQSVVLHYVIDVFRMNGLEWRCATYFNTVNGTGSADISNVGNLLMRIGSVSSAAPFVNLTTPTLIEVTQCKWFGAVNKVQIFVSTDSRYYTNVHLENLVIEESGDNYTLQVTHGGAFGVDTGFAHVQVRDLTHAGINGPNSSVHYPGDPNAVAFGTHVDGTGGLTMGNLDGGSTMVISEVDSLCEIQGSLNHDMHSMSVTSIHSKDVRYTLRDSLIRGHWSKGSLSAPPAFGTTFSHLWYYHFNNIPDYVTLGQRPVITFENVTFESRINQAVDNDLFSNDPLTPDRDLIWTNESASYQFFDCTFRWIIENPLYDNPTLTGIAERSDNIDTGAHNCIFDIGNNGVDYLPKGRVNAVFAADAESRGFREEKWHRIHALDRIQRENIFGAPSFETQVSIP